MYEQCKVIIYHRKKSWFSTKQSEHKRDHYMEEWNDKNRNDLILKEIKVIYVWFSIRLFHFEKIYNIMILFWYLSNNIV